MNKKKKKWIKRVIIAVIALALLGGLVYLGWLLYGQPEETNEREASMPRERFNVEESVEANKSSTNLTGEYYELNNGKLRMRIYLATTMFSLEELDEDGRTIRTWYSNPGGDSVFKDGASLTDTVAVGATKLNEMRSTLIVSYSSSSADKDLNSWEYCVDKQAYSFGDVEEREDGSVSIDVRYTIGFIASESQIPTVIPEARWEELKEIFASSEDKTTRSKWSAFTSNFNSWTVQELLLGKYDAKTGKLSQSTTTENRQLAAHLIETKLADQALQSEEYMWVQEAITTLNNASIEGFDREAALSLIEAHLDEMDAETAALLREAAENGTEEDRAALAATIRAIPDPEAATAEDTGAGEDIEPEETAEEIEEEDEIDWREELADNFERPDVDPFDAEAMLSLFESHSEESFFTGAESDWYDELTRYVLLDEEFLAENEIENAEDAYREASSMLEDRIVAVELAKEENSWASALIDLISDGDETFSEDAVRQALTDLTADETLAQLLSTEKYYVMKDSVRREAKANLTLGLKGGSAGSAVTKGIGYTEEDYLSDSKWALPADESVDVLFNVTVRYILDGEDFLVEVPFEEIRYNANAPITYLTLLPFFGAAGQNKDGSYDDGFVLVPEGGGALIRYNNGKIRQNNYISNLYGWDYASKRTELVGETKSAFPVFGMTYSNPNDSAEGSFLCIIEEGSAYAMIQADINGQAGMGSGSSFHPNSYNTASAKYHVLHSDQYNVSAKTANMVIMYEKTVPEGSIIQRYRFLDSDSYVDMANAYGEYLQAEYPELQETDASEDMPVSVELIAAINKRVVTAGLPIDRTVAVTTFSQAQEIIGSLEGVSALSVRVSGWANGGVRQRVLTSVHVEGVLGGESGMKSLIAYASSKHIPLYFDGITCFAYRSGLTEGFAYRSNAARFTTREVAKLTPYSQVTYVEDTNQNAYYLVQPEYASDTAAKLISHLSGTGAYGVAFRDIGSLLSANYDPNRLVTRQQVMRMNVETLRAAREAGERVMIREGFDFAVPYADIITDMDLGGTSYAILDEAVPFYQIALHTRVDYTGPALNMASDWRTELLRCAEYGAGLNFTFMYANGEILQDTLYSDYRGANWEKWREEAIDLIAQYQADMSGLNRTRIVGHMSVTDDVKLTVYEDGTLVYVNYGDTDYTLPGRSEVADSVGQPIVDFPATVAARSYAVIRGYIDSSGEADTTGAVAHVSLTKDVKLTIYGNGTRVYVNYGDTDFALPGHTDVSDTLGEPDEREPSVVAAHSYAVVQGSQMTHDGINGVQLQLIVDATGARTLVNFTDKAFQTGSGAVISPYSTRRFTDGETADVIFLEDGSRLYINAGSESILVAGNTVEVRPGEMLLCAPEAEADDDTDAEAEPANEGAGGSGAPETAADYTDLEVIFTADGHVLFINNTNREMRVGAEAIPAITAGSTVQTQYLRVTDDAGIYAVIVTPEEGDVYDLYWVNATDADITLTVGFDTPAAEAETEEAETETEEAETEPEPEEAETEPAEAEEDTVANSLFSWIAGAFEQATAQPQAEEPAEEEPAEEEPAEEEPAEEEPAEEEPAAANVTEETVPAHGILRSQSAETQLVVFRPDGARLYVNRSAANASYGTGSDAVTANQSVMISDDEPFDIFLIDTENAIFVNNTDQPLELLNGEQAVELSIPAMSAVKVDRTALSGVDAIFLPDGRAIVVNNYAAGRKVEYGTESVSATRYRALDARDIPSILRDCPAGPTNTDPDQLYWINTTDHEMDANGVTLPARSMIPMEAAQDDSGMPFTLVNYPELGQWLIYNTSGQDLTTLSGATVKKDTIVTLTGRTAGNATVNPDQSLSWDDTSTTQFVAAADLDAIRENDGAIWWLNTTEEDITITDTQGSQTIPAGGVVRNTLTDQAIVLLLRDDELLTAEALGEKLLAQAEAVSGDTSERDARTAAALGEQLAGLTLTGVSASRDSVVVLEGTVRGGSVSSGDSASLTAVSHTAGFGEATDERLGILLLEDDRILLVNTTESEIQCLGATVPARSVVAVNPEEPFLAVSPGELGGAADDGLVYINHSGAEMSAVSGKLEAHSLKTVSRSDPDAVITADGVLYWVNTTDAALPASVEGEAEVPARSAVRSETQDPLLLIHLPDEETEEDALTFTSSSSSGSDKTQTRFGARMGIVLSLIGIAALALLFWIVAVRRGKINDRKLQIIFGVLALILLVWLVMSIVNAITASAGIRADEEAAAAAAIEAEARAAEEAATEAATPRAENVGRIYLNLTDSVIHADSGEIDAHGVKSVRDTIALDILVSEDGRLWLVNNREESASAFGVTVEGDTLAEVSAEGGVRAFVREDGVLLVNGGGQSATVGETTVEPGSCAEVGSLDEGVLAAETVTVYNLTEAPITVDGVTVQPLSSGQIAAREAAEETAADPEPPGEESPGDSEPTEEGRDE